MTDREKGRLARRLDRFHRIRSLADNLTIPKRLGAATIAAVITFPLVWFGFAVLWGGGDYLVWASWGAVCAAAFAAFTLRRVAAIAYGAVAAVMLVLEMVAVVIASVVGAIG